jgi:hypothetical protein
LIEELPYHIENLEARRDLEKFASNTIGEKNQIKGKVGNDAVKMASKKFPRGHFLWRSKYCFGYDTKLETCIKQPQNLSRVSF